MSQTAPKPRFHSGALDAMASYSSDGQPVSLNDLRIARETTALIDTSNHELPCAVGTDASAEERQQADVSVGWDLGNHVMRPAVVVLERVPGGAVIRESFVGEDALSWLRVHIPTALAKDAPNAGHAAFNRMEDIP